jgi:cytochrome b involved in lipid metabolism
MIPETTVAIAKPPTPNPSTAKQYTLTELAAHSANNDCWTAIDDQVFDISSFLSQHPNNLIYQLCGVEGSTMFHAQHNACMLVRSTVNSKGILIDPATAPSPPTATSPTNPTTGNPGEYTLVDVAAHSANNDCWTAIDGTVYDLTSWLPLHTKSRSIYLLCGIEGSSIPVV